MCGPYRSTESTPKPCSHELATCRPQARSRSPLHPEGWYRQQLHSRCQNQPHHRGPPCFRGHLPTAHTLACLRFAGPVTETVARLATGWAGSPLAGRDSHPLGDKRSFMESSHSSNSNRPAEPGRTGDSACVSDPRRSRDGVSNPSGIPLAGAMPCISRPTRRRGSP